MGVRELNDGRGSGVGGGGATSVTAETKGGRKAVVGDGWESMGRRVVVRVVLRDTLAAGTTTKEIRKD